MPIIRQRPAQSLLEAILAIGVILTATISATTLVVTTITTGQISKDNIQAANYAREGLEIIRGFRDSNWLQRQQNVQNAATSTLFAWDDIPEPTGSQTKLTDSAWIAEYDPTSGHWKLRPPAGTNTVLSLRQSPTVVTQNCSTGCTSTKFSRTITVTQGNEIPRVAPSQAYDYLNVVSTVTWQNRGTKTYSLTERLYDWR